MKEVPHNTLEQVPEYVRAAVQLVDDLAVPDDLRVAAFTKAVDLYSAKQLFIDPTDAASPVIRASQLIGPAH